MHWGAWSSKNWFVLFLFVYWFFVLTLAIGLACSTLPDGQLLQRGQKSDCCQSECFSNNFWQVPGLKKKHNESFFGWMICFVLSPWTMWGSCYLLVSLCQLFEVPLCHAHLRRGRAHSLVCGPKAEHCHKCLHEHGRYPRTAGLTQTHSMLKAGHEPHGFKTSMCNDNTMFRQGHINTSQ